MQRISLTDDIPKSLDKLKIYLSDNNNIRTIYSYKTNIENFGKNLTKLLFTEELSSNNIDLLTNNENLKTLKVYANIPCYIINDNFHNLTTLKFGRIFEQIKKT